MSDLLAPDDDYRPENAPSLAEVTARRVAARSQWQKALARAQERFAPANLRDEAVHNVAETIGGAADKAATMAWAHRGKLALTGLLGGLLYFRKPVAKAVAPLAGRAKASAHRASEAVRRRTRR